MARLSSRWIFDGSGDEVFAGTVFILGTRIAKVQRSSSGTVTDRTASVNLDGFAILPGLIDAHSHLGMVVQPRGATAALATVAAQVFDNARIAVEEGFTTVRDLGGLDGGLVEAIGRGLVVGPRILPSGPMLSQRGGHADGRPAFDHGLLHVSLPGLVQSSVLVDGDDEMRSAARMALRDGATQLKVALSGGFASAGDQLDDVQFGLEELRTAVEVANGRHTYVTAHAHHSEAVRLGLLAGIKCFEHGTFVDAETVQEMRSHQAIVVATLSILQRLLQDPELRLRPELAERAQEAFPAMSRMVKMAIAGGVTVGSGSDQVGPEQRNRARELTVRAQVTDPLEAIAAATGVNARILRIDGSTGCLREGLVADLIAVEGNPAEEPELFQDPSRVQLVIRGGKICKNSLPEPLAAEVSKELWSQNL